MKPASSVSGFYVSSVIGTSCIMVWIEAFIGSSPEAELAGEKLLMAVLLWNGMGLRGRMEPWRRRPLDGLRGSSMQWVALGWCGRMIEAAPEGPQVAGVEFPRQGLLRGTRCEAFRYPALLLPQTQHGPASGSSRVYAS